MNAEQLWETTLNPDTRRLAAGAAGFAGLCADLRSLMTKLMGKGEASARRELMELHGDSVELDVLTNAVPGEVRLWRVSWTPS
jgi:topoisomerase-4 subunit B